MWCGFIPINLLFCFHSVVSTMWWFMFRLISCFVSNHFLLWSWWYTISWLSHLIITNVCRENPEHVAGCRSRLETLTVQVWQRAIEDSRYPSTELRPWYQNCGRGGGTFQALFNVCVSAFCWNDIRYCVITKKSHVLILAASDCVSVYGLFFFFFLFLSIGSLIFSFCLTRFICFSCGENESDLTWCSLTVVKHNKPS